MAYVRALHFAATILAAGVVIFRFLAAEPAFRTASGDFRPSIETLRRRWTWMVWTGLAFAAVSAAVWVLLLAADIYGASVGEVWRDGGVWTVVTQTRFGQVWSLRFVLGVLLAALIAALMPAPMNAGLMNTGLMNAGPMNAAPMDAVRRGRLADCDPARHRRLDRSGMDRTRGRHAWGCRAIRFGLRRVPPVGGRRLGRRPVAARDAARLRAAWKTAGLGCADIRSRAAILAARHCQRRPVVGVGPSQQLVRSRQHR
jgi:hypothetical protein